MANGMRRLNTIYISQRLQACLRPIGHASLTTVVAPMGYGKTTAVNYFLDTCTKKQASSVIRVSVYSDHLAIFWRSVQDAFAHAGFDFLRDYACPTDAAGSSLLADDLCHALAGTAPCYLFIDDFHLLTDGRICRFLCTLSNQLPPNVHLIVASRDQFLPPEQVLRLGAKLYQLGTPQLRLSQAELASYAHRCGAALSEQQLSQLLYVTEGWFSAAYLTLKAFCEHGTLPDHNSDIYTMFTAAMIDPLDAAQREFLAAMSLADEFSVEMAVYITKDPEAEALLVRLSERNAFVRRLPDGVSFRFHHLMKACALRTFESLAPALQTAYCNRFGAWYASQQQYLHAMGAYWQSKNFDALLRVIQQDAGILLASLHPEQVLDVLQQCPVPVLKAHPTALLVLMRRMFTWNQIPKMLELKSLLMDALDENSALPDPARGNLLGECDLIMSFLCYNDIRAMSRLHRSASARMSRPAISIQNRGGWTFGSPSVFMMFHRTPGALFQELSEMDECMPHYYKVTNGHGLGAERIMRSEAAFLQGRLLDAQILLEKARAQIAGSGQENMALCADFLSLRLSLCTDAAPCKRLQLGESALQRHDAALLHLWSAACAYYYALLGQTEKIPVRFRTHQLGAICFLSPGKPMMDLIENQVYLAQGDYLSVIGRSEALLGACAQLHYSLVCLHVHIQTAAAYAMLGKLEAAQLHWAHALQLARADELLLPFAENYRYLQALMALPAAADDAQFLQKLSALGEKTMQRRARLLEQADRPVALLALSAREYEIVRLMAAHLRNREIGELLFLSEGSVKQYINQIYAKLHIEGQARTKRQRLISLLSQNS